MPSSREFRLNLLSGSPNSLRKAELDDWPGVVVLAPRIQLRDLVDREELGSPAVYLLRNEEGEKPRTYIGMTREPRVRIQNHFHAKDWWTEAAIIASDKREGLDIADAMFLEAKMLEEIRKVGRVNLENSEKSASIPRIREARIAEMDRFFAGIKEILPLVQICDFVEESQIDSGPHPQLPRFVMKVPGAEDRATGFLNQRGGQFVIERGSPARGRWVGTASGNENTKRLLSDLMERRIIVQGSDGVFRFTRDCPFGSLSAAAKVVAGAPRSGSAAWTERGTKRTFKEWERDTISAPPRTRVVARSPVPPPASNPLFQMTVPGDRGIATAVFDEATGEFVVQKGSCARGSWVGQSSGNENAKRLHKELLDQNILKAADDGVYRFAVDYRFKSASAAAKVIAGTPVSGPRMWSSPDTGKTFGEWTSTRRKSPKHP